MADFLLFTEGKNDLVDHGLPLVCRFLLSTKATADFVAGDTLASGVAEITGTGYARQSQAAPSATAGLVAFAAMTWETGTATDWPAAVRSVVLVTSADYTGKAICAWNLQADGVARDLSGAETTETFTASLRVV